MKLLFKPMLAAALVLYTISANALVIEISDTADFAGTVIAAADTDNDGMVSINSALGSWVVNVVTGLSGPLIGSDPFDKVHLNSVNVSGGVGTIYIRLTDTDFDALKDAYFTSFGGVTNGSVNFQSYADASNVEFGQGILLSDSGNVSSGAFSGSDAGQFNVSNPYSLSIYAAVTHSGGFQVSSFDYEISVPEPGTLAFLCIGLFGLGAARRAKKI